MQPASADAHAAEERADPFLAGLVRLMALEAESSACAARQGIRQALSQARRLHLAAAARCAAAEPCAACLRRDAASSTQRRVAGALPAPPAGAVPPARRAGLAPWQRRRAEQLMLECGGRGGAIAEVARACGLSRGHFSAAFRHTTGQSPHRWLMARRIERACALLVQTTMPLSEVASECGFADQSHMTRSFSKAMGLSPAAWRRRERE